MTPPVPVCSSSPAKGRARPAVLLGRGMLSVVGGLAVVFVARVAVGENTLRTGQAVDLGEFRTSFEVALVSRPSDRGRDFGQLRASSEDGRISRSQVRKGDLGEFRTTLDVGPIAKPMNLGEFRAVLDLGSSAQSAQPRSVDLGEFRTTLDATPESVFPVR